MSAQCYTNKRRILAEASLRKVQYPGSIGLNNHPLYASINCKPDFSELVYLIKLCCVRTYSTEKPPIRIIILEGGRSTTLSLDIVDGGNALTDSYDIIDGGNS
jgi:hypothetical protein